MSTPTHRLALAPDAETEIAGVLRLLALQPWLVAGRDDAAIGAVRRNLEAVRAVLSRLGWVLIVERDLVRLLKSPPPRLEDRVLTAPAPLTCSWFFLLAAAAEGLPRQVSIGSLVEAAKAAAAEAEVPVTGDRGERRAITRAVRLLADRGVIEETDGRIDAFLDDDEAPVLLTIFHTRVLHLIANYDPSTDPVADPDAWLDRVGREPDHGRRMRRRLVDDTCVHAADLDEAELDWLSRRVRSGDGGPLATAYGMVVERRGEGAAFVVPDDAFRWPRELGETPFPTTGLVPHVATLVIDTVAAEGSVGSDEGSGSPGPGWRGMPEPELRRWLAELARSRTTGTGGWPAERAADPDGLLADVARLLRGAGLLRIRGGHWWLSPVTGRWEAPPNAALSLTPPTPPASRVPTGAPGTLFDQEDAP